MAFSAQEKSESMLGGSPSAPICSIWKGWELSEYKIQFLRFQTDYLRYENK
jgi:hypothetical protein